MIAAIVLVLCAVGLLVAYGLIDARRRAQDRRRNVVKRWGR